MDVKDIKQVLKTYYGYDEFRPLQEEIIMHTIEGNDSLVLMPTGSVVFIRGAKVLNFCQITLYPHKFL